MVKNKSVHLTIIYILKQNQLVFIIVWVMFGLNIDIQSKKLHLNYNFGIQ
jgi:hypothetical protein